MLRALLMLLVAALLIPLAWTGEARGEERRRKRAQPHAGFVFPAGGQVGTTVRVAVGGQYLRRVTAAHVSGPGVRADVVYWIPPLRPLDGKQKRELRRQLAVLRAAQRPTTNGGRRGRRPPAKAPAEEVKFPEHPLLEDLEKKTADELDEVERYFFQRRNPLQRKRAIEETVKIDLRIAPDAEPGLRELRLTTKSGLSNPLRFRVGLIPEVREREPNDPGAARRGALTLPVVVNGQILPRDVDQYRFRAVAGQRLVLRAEARGLIPYQADSVPGWMQTTLALFDASGTEVAYADEYRFDPDPVLLYEVPKDGEYVLEVRDAIARGRADFVYRVSIGELPFITRVFPLGGREGELVRVEVDGWNLAQQKLPLDTRAGGSALRRTEWRWPVALTNSVAYAVDTLPERVEQEPNDASDTAEALTLPLIVNGRIGAPDDKDLFRFEGSTGQEVVIDVRARALGSPLDSLVRVLDAKGAVIAWNDDDRPEGLGVRGLGLQTHAADSYLRAKLPRKGTYYVQLSDVRQHGTADHAYRLRVSAPRPDVELYVTPSGINLAAGRAEPVSVYAIRRDGFDGPVDIELVGREGSFSLSGARIPAGQDRVDLTLTAPVVPMADPVALRLEGILRIGREEIRRPVVPADNVMQAFLWRHLVPAEELAVTVRGNGRWVPVVTLAEKRPVRLKRGRTTRVRFNSTRKVAVDRVEFELIGGPAGVTIESVESRHDGFVLVLKTSRDAKRTDTADNLIIESFGRQPPPKKVDGKKVKKPKPGAKRAPTGRRWSVGVLPAVPFVIQRG